MKNLEIKLPGTPEKEGTTTVPVSQSSQKGKLKQRDWLLGLLMAVGTPVLTYLYDALMSFLNYDPVEFDWRTMVKFGISAGVIYISKNLMSAGGVFIKTKDLIK
jgi:hypothetical protein